MRDSPIDDLYFSVGKIVSRLVSDRIRARDEVRDIVHEVWIRVMDSMIAQFHKDGSKTLFK